MGREIELPSLQNMVRIFFILLIFVVPVHADDPKGLFYNPTDLFSKAFLPVLSHFERAKIETTWRGFISRADSQPGFKSEYLPTHQGLLLIVEVRDAKEIPKFEDEILPSGQLTKRYVKLPAPKGESLALRITFIYGPEANAEVVASIDQCIRDTIEAAQVTPSFKP